MIKALKYYCIIQIFIGCSFTILGVEATEGSPGYTIVNKKRLDSLFSLIERNKKINNYEFIRDTCQLNRDR